MSRSQTNAGQSDVDPPEEAVADDSVPVTEADEADEAEAGKPGEDAIPFNLPSGPSKTAVTAQQISLPKGEGSIEGMGESFTPNLSSGSGSFSVPIALPKGRAGVQPSLALTYSTNAGNSILGIGWSLALPVISRQTDKGLPRYEDSAAWAPQEDTFIYNGGQELVPVDNNTTKSIDGAGVPDALASWQQYRARVEGAFLRFFRAPDANRWVVQSKDGTLFEFGLTGPDSAIANAARDQDPEDPSRIFAWHLVRMSDVHGSTVHYTYSSNAGTSYPESIYYTSPATCGRFNNPSATRACSAALSTYAQRVRFVYESRPDVTSSFVAGYRTEIALRLKRIEVTSAGETTGSRSLVRRYHLKYLADSYHSLLSSVQVEGRPSTRSADLGVMVGATNVAEGSLDDRIVGDLLPPLRFEYTEPPRRFGEIFGFGGVDATVRYAARSPDHSADEGRADLFDVNADGLPDLLVTDPARYAHGAGVYFNGLSPEGPTRPGSFSEGVRVGIAEGLSGTLNLASVNIVPMDVDGDGRSDILHMPRNAGYGYFVLSKAPPVRGRGYDATRGWSFHHVTDLLPKGVTDPRIDLGKDGLAIKTLDVNNDHLVDIVRTTGREVQTWLNLGQFPGGEGRFGSATYGANGVELSTLPIATCLPFAGQSLDFSDPRVRTADMNGDGLLDIVKVSPEEVLWWPGRGLSAFGDGSRSCDERSRAGREIRMKNPPRELNTELAGLHLVDINADGATDFVYVGFSELSVWYNQGGDALTDRLVIDGTPYAVDALDRVRIADVDATGTTDILFADSGRWRWLDLMGGVRPRLLTTVDNGLGALTTLEYSSSVVDYLRDLAESGACDPAALDCFTWQRELLRQGQTESDCDARVLDKSGTCARRSTGSPVVSTVVRRVRTSDRFDAFGVDAQESETEYRYHEGYYEGIEQEFRGFAAADAIVKGDEYEPTSITRTYFHQGRRPNDIAANRVADNPNEALKGREYLTEIWDASGTYLKSAHVSYAVRRLFFGLNGTAVSYAYARASDELRYDTSVRVQTPGTSIVVPSVTREVSQPGLLAFAEASLEPGDLGHSMSVRHTSYARLRETVELVDNAGNMRTKTTWGRGGRGEFGELVADERIVTRTDALYLQDTNCANTQWLWRASRSWIEGPNGEQLRLRIPSYSTCGDLLSETKFAGVPIANLDFQGGAGAESFTLSSRYEAASSRFDVFGQVIASCEGASVAYDESKCLRLTKVRFDAAYAHVPVSEETLVGTSDAVSTLVTTATWDRGLVSPVSVTDPAGNVSEVVYDGLGRLTSTIMPKVAGCAAIRTPTVRIDYELTDSPTTRPVSLMKSTALLDCVAQSTPDSELVTYHYVDGLGRRRATLSQGDASAAAWADATGHAYVRKGLSNLTKKGQARTVFQPSFYEGHPSDFGKVLALPGSPSKTSKFDGFGRLVLAVNEDGATFSSKSYHALSHDSCDEVDNGAACPGDAGFEMSCTTERTDGHGRVVDQQLRQVTPEGTKENHRLFSYYRADGSVLRVVRALTGDNILRPESGYAGLTSWVERRFHYDSLGRRIASEDPDADDRTQGSLTRRTWRYLFNTVGDLVAVRDPRGCGQNFYYDLAGRLLGETYVGCAEAQEGERASLDIPAGSVSLGKTTAPVMVHVRNYFDEYPSWVTAFALPGGLSGNRGRLTATADRAQRSLFGYDARGQAVWQARQLAVPTGAVEISETRRPDGRPSFDATSEQGVVSSVAYDTAVEHTYQKTTKFDHGGRSVEAGYPLDPDFQGGAPVLAATLSYHRTGSPRRAELSIDGVSRPVISNVAYTYDGLPETTTYGDDTAPARSPTESRVLYDVRRRPIHITTTRSPTGSTPEALSAVSIVQDQRLTWDGASNLCRVDDRRDPGAWPSGHKPYSQDIFHDALYRVTSVFYDYKTPTFDDTATDWRTEEGRHRTADPMKATAAEMVARQGSKRVKQLDYAHDWLANMTSWKDDARVFYERSIGTILNGQDLTPNATQPNAPGSTLRPSALYLAANLLPEATSPEQADRGGWLETDYGKGGNLLALTVHGQCSHTSGTSCVMPTSGDLTARRNALRSGCTCAKEQHYVYRWDELNRLHDARRYDRNGGGEWTLAARQRARYDGANQRTVKQTFDVSNGTHRAALYIYPGDFERRGLVPSSDGTRWITPPDGRTETQYLVAGARVVWQNHEHGDMRIDPKQRITFAVTNLIQSTSAVVDLVSGELVEVGGFYPNGAREESLAASRDVPLEPVGFTGKEADEEVGIVYFGERYLVSRIGRWATPDPAEIHAQKGGEVGNSYHYVSGNLLQARDPLGLWSTYDTFYAEPVHQMAVQKVLGAVVEKRFLDILIKQQEEIDTHQMPEDQDMHAMRGGYTHKAAETAPVYSDKKHAMIERANDFVKDSLNAAVRNYQAGDLVEAFKNLGNAIHTVQDATSPEHEGFQIFYNREQQGNGKSSWVGKVADLAAGALHGSGERTYPQAGTREANRLEGATQWVFDVFTSRLSDPSAKGPERFFETGTGKLLLPKEYSKGPSRDPQQAGSATSTPQATLPSPQATLPNQTSPDQQQVCAE